MSRYEKGIGAGFTHGFMLIGARGGAVDWGTKSRKVAGSIPDGVIWNFYWRNSSGRTLALGSIQPLTEMSTRDISWGVKAAGA
jgi:hypothetical protein